VAIAAGLFLHLGCLARRKIHRRPDFHPAPVSGLPPSRVGRICNKPPCSWLICGYLSVVKLALQKFGDTLKSQWIMIVKVVPSLEKLYFRLLDLPIDGFKVGGRRDTIINAPGDKNW
jgi:hypothetical protein